MKYFVLALKLKNARLLGNYGIKAILKISIYYGPIYRVLCVIRPLFQRPYNEQTGLCVQNSYLIHLYFYNSYLTHSNNIAGSIKFFETY